METIKERFNDALYSNQATTVLRNVMRHKSAQMSTSTKFIEDVVGMMRRILDLIKADIVNQKIVNRDNTQVITVTSPWYGTV